MTEKPANTPDLDSAYALKTPEDNRALYARWASSYDRSFAEAMGYLMPGHVARLFRTRGGTGPVLDVGAGTGLVAAALREAGTAAEIDALDISPEMLAVAEGKRLYRRCICADLTQPLPLAAEQYRAVVSSGTFTHGHVGPEALEELLRVAAPGALFVLTIKTEHYEARGFAAAFDGFGARIAGLTREALPIYSAAGDDPAHGRDMGLVVGFVRV